MSELRAELTALKTTGGIQDRARLRYIESLLQRAEGCGGQLGELLQAKARDAMANYRQKAARPQRTHRTSPDNQPLRELNRLLDSLRDEHDDPYIAPLEAALRQQELALADAMEEQARVPGRKSPDRQPQDRQQELKAAWSARRWLRYRKRLDH